MLPKHNVQSPKSMTRSLVWASLALALSASGCARLTAVTAAKLMVQAPNTLDPRIGLANARPIDSPESGFDNRFWVGVGPPAAHLLVSVVEPKPKGVCPNGTVLVLHGAYYRSEDMVAPAQALASRGYRAVLIDLRGHGQSSGDRITWGVQESADVCQVINALERNRLLAGGLGVYGYSFGAATGIQLAARDPRVQAVVAIAPYSSLGDATRHIVRSRMPGAAMFADEQWIAETVQEAGREGRFDVRTVSAAAAIQKTRAQVLLVHGDSDNLVPPHHSLLLHRAAPGHSRVVFLRGAGHGDLIGKKTGTVVSLAVSWFDQWMTRSPRTGQIRSSKLEIRNKFQMTKSK
jgi:pimeloyl-ACP methyl ester carboxylesterase